jgi:hypothetical protein
MNPQVVADILRQIGAFLDVNPRPSLQQISAFAASILAKPSSDPLEGLMLESPVEYLQEPLILDEGALYMVPREFQDRVPASSTGDGACLFNTASLIFSKHENYNLHFRLASVLQTMLHNEYFLSQSIFETDWVYSDNALNNPVLLDESSEYKKEKEYVEEIRTATKEKANVSLLLMHGLASAIGRPIQSVFQASTRAMIMSQMYTQMIDPYHQKHKEPIYIMWVCHWVKNFETAQIAIEEELPRTNHFVPLLLPVNIVTDESKFIIIVFQ